MATLQFAPWSSDVELSFYASLASQKINHDKLDDRPREVLGNYEIRTGDVPERSGRLQVLGNAYTSSDPPQGQYRAEGLVRNLNTIEEYKSLDRAVVLEEAGRRIWNAIVEGSVFENPALLSSFHAIFFADLKKYKYTYHFAFPAIHSDPAWKVDDSEAMSLQDSAAFFSAVQSWRFQPGIDSRQHGFFLAKRTSSDDNQTQAAWQVGALHEKSDFFFNVPRGHQYLCFADPSTYPTNPAWCLRNLLALAKYSWSLPTARIVCFRDQTLPRTSTSNVILNLTCPESTPGASNSPQMPKVTGWERNPTTGKLTSRTIDLSATMDPRRLADASVDLNLKLMKWRIAPSLDLDTIATTRCLLLGSGTLGSYVARNLLGWGVRHITFVDNGRVSFSNPVRQPLFNFADCLNGGKDKAKTAAQALHDIYPGVRSEGIKLSVPMAGHPLVSSEDEVKVLADYRRLEELFDSHDVVFLLMDTRESRWLPTLMGKAKRKIVVNAALGFDSFVVMRHGALPASTAAPATQTPSESAASKSADEEELGCYFCTDVFAPRDSLADRTLDQQCTVTRPGVASLASALLVEMVVSVLQHPRRARAAAPASRAANRDPSDHPLGLVPHSIRGFLGTWDNVMTKGPAYECCSACGAKVLEGYGQSEEQGGGWAFVKRALNEKGWIDEVSGLAEVQRLAEEASREIEALEVSEDEDEGEGELI